MNNSYKMYGAEFSYYSGKTRSYLRKKGLPFEEIQASAWIYLRFIVPRTGVRFIPVVQTPDDKVYQDTTVIIDELERRHPEHSVCPQTPKQKLVSLLLELYADEWLVLPAMHYRWNYMEQNADFVYQQFGELALPNAPAFLQRWLGVKLGGIFKGFVPLLGITDNNHKAIEASYEQLLDDLSTHFEQHEYMLGSKPSLADFGFMGSLYAHLYRDPAPRELMFKRAPLVAKWVEKMNAPEATLQHGEWVTDDHVPETLLPILMRMVNEQMPVLIKTKKRLAQWRLENPDSDEIKRIIGRHKFTVEGVEEERCALSYPLWMLQRAADYYQSLEDTTTVDELLDQIGFDKSLLQTGLDKRLTRVNNRLKFAG